MAELRYLNIVIYGVLLAYMARGAIASATCHARFGDPMRLACALTAVLLIAFNAYWLLGPAASTAPSDTLMNGLLILSAALGCFILKLGMTYGRGALLDRMQR